MAVKFHLPDGSVTDLLGQTSPRFPTDEPEVFVKMTEATEKPLTIPLFLARHPGVLPPHHRQHPRRVRRAAGQLRGGHLLPDPRLRLAGRRWQPHLGALHLPTHRDQGGPARPAVRGLGPAGRGDGRPPQAPPGHPRGLGPGRRPMITTRTARPRCGRAVATSSPAGSWSRRRRTTPSRWPRRRSSTPLVRSTASSCPTTRSSGTGHWPTPSRSPGGWRGRPLKALVIGTGGREHALARALAREPAVNEVHAAPGNPGIAALATLHDVDQMTVGRGRPGREPRRRPRRHRARRRRWSPGWRTRCGPRGSRSSDRPVRPRDWRGRRRSPRT